MWLLHMEQTDGCQIMHARNGREYRPPELPHYSVDVYCPDTKIIYEILGCFYHGHTCQHFRDVRNMGGDTLAERYERTISRLEQITQAGYQVKIQWECEFHNAGTVNQKPQLLTHSIVEQSSIHTRDALCGVELKQCVYTIKPQRMRPSNMLMSYVCTHTSANTLSFQSDIRSFT